jgi:ADP-ribose pyrophosphatase
MDKIRRIKRELKYTGSILKMYSDTMEFPNGNTAEWDLISHKGAAAVVAVKENGNLLMVRQYRNALERETIELPAGAKDYPEEESSACAARELEEETGYKCENLRFLISIYTTVAFCNEKIDIFLARDLIPSHQHLDENEFLNVEEWELSDLVRMIYEGKLQDGKTVAAILAYQNLLHSSEEFSVPKENG